MLKGLPELTPRSGSLNFAAREQESAFSNAAESALKPMNNPVLLGIVAFPEIELVYTPARTILNFVLLSGNLDCRKGGKYFGNKNQ